MLTTNNFSIFNDFKTKGGKILSLLWNTNNDLNIGYASGMIELRKSGKTNRVLFAHSSGVNSLVYNHKINSLISCSYDGTIKIWDINDFDAKPIIINDHDAWVYCLALSPDNKKLISGSADKSIRITNIDVNNLKTIVRKNVNKNMSEKNWERFVGEGIEYLPDLPEN